MTHRQRTSPPVMQRVLHLLRQRIAQEIYPSGQMMPTERALASELAVSRTTISRALAQLAAEGLIMQQQGSGTRVLPEARQQLPPSGIAVVYAFDLEPLRPEPARLLQGAEDALTRLGCAYHLLPLVPDSFDGPIGRAIRHADLAELPATYGALLFIETAGVPDQVLALHQHGLPLVVANLEIDLPVPATWVDHAKVARNAVRVLAALGHQRIGLVMTRPELAFYQKTLDGYRAGLADAHLDFEPSLVVTCPRTTALEAYLATRSLLTTATPPPTAIVAGRDTHAEGIIRAAEELGLTLGRDLSLVGYDDITWPAGAALLTTFREPCYEMGAKAAEMLLQRIYQRDVSLEQAEIPALLILRRSAGPYPDVPASPSPYTIAIDIRD